MSWDKVYDVRKTVQFETVALPEVGLWISPRLIRKGA